MSKKDKIEILGLQIFSTHTKEIEIIERMQKYFGHGIGWHYYLDLAWIIRQVQMLPKGSLILDAGAGTGLAQFILSELGYNIISADFTNRNFSQKHLGRYREILHFINDQSQTFNNRYTQHLKKIYKTTADRKKESILNKISMLFHKKTNITFDQCGDVLSFIEQTKYNPKDNNSYRILKGNAAENCGRIFIYKSDLKDMSLLPDNFVDGVVSVSALEHNVHEDLRKCVEEILRVTRRDGQLLITVSASQSDDWLHEPSKGWCYSEASIKKLFGLHNNVQSNFSQKDRLFKELRQENNELHQRLASFYYKSGDNGMPWGKWDPQYQPVGIVLEKGEDNA